MVSLKWKSKNNNLKDQFNYLDKGGKIKIFFNSFSENKLNI